MSSAADLRSDNGYVSKPGTVEYFLSGPLPRDLYRRLRRELPVFGVPRVWQCQSREVPCPGLPILVQFLTE